MHSDVPVECKQCRLERGSEQLVIWLPVELAKDGKIVDFATYGKGWKVLSSEGITRVLQLEDPFLL